MVKKLTISCILLAVMAYGIFFDPQPAATYHTVPPPFNAGAPGQGSCSITGCHSGSVNTGGGSTAIIFNGTDNNYESGKTYDMSLLISDATASRYGFQMVAFDETDKSTGNFVAANSNTTTQTTASVQFINHNNVPSPSPSTFNFQWTAPGTDKGVVTFYASANAANGNGTSTGDKIYTTSLSINPKQEVGFEQLLVQTSVFPNPVSDVLNVHLENISLGNVGIVLTDMNGKMVQVQDHFLYDSSFETQLDMSDLPTGTYLLVIANEFHHLTRKIVKK